MKIKYPKQLLSPILKYLKKEERELAKRKKKIESEDPFKDSQRLNDNASDDTEAAEQLGHHQSQALGEETGAALKRVREAMERVERGVYGQCESCGEMIDTDRLGIDPTAKYCINCAKLNVK